MISVKARKASEIAKIVDGKLYGEDFLIDKISFNSKEKMQSGCLFIGIRGKNYDGNDFISEAIENGADLVITDRHNLSKCCIVVCNTLDALLKLASSSIGNTKIIGITGSVGKTTVKNMIISVLGQKYRVIGTKENENNEIGVAKTLLKIKNEDFCVVEMGMRGIGEIDLLSSVSRPELVVITNVKASHIERLGSEENILNAKLEILNYEPKYAVLPNDIRIVGRDFGKIIPFFVEEDVDKYNHTFFENGIEFFVNNGENNPLKMKIYSFFLHNIHNAEIAYRVGKIYGLGDDEIAAGLISFKQDKMREEYLEINGITVINDCYNSSYESLKSSLNSLVSYANLKGKRPNALIGDILELGKYGKEIHRKIGYLCKELKIHGLYLYGNESNYISAGAGYGEIFDCKEELIRELCRKLDKNDVLLVKASRGLMLEKVIEGMKKFNE